jgi:hypothetical protein
VVRRAHAQEQLLLLHRPVGLAGHQQQRRASEMKTVLIGDNELSRKDLEAVSEMVHDALCDMGINPASFAWCIEVEYTEEEEVR